MAIAVAQFHVKIVRIAHRPCTLSIIQKAIVQGRLKVRPLLNKAL